MAEELNQPEVVEASVEQEDADIAQADSATEIYSYDRTMVTLTLTLFPADGHANGRLVGVSVRSTDESPMIANPLRESEVELTDQMKTLLDQYRQLLPIREEQHQAQVAEEKVKAEEKRVQQEKDRASQSTGKVAKNPRPDPVKGRSRKVVPESSGVVSKGLFD